ncbi:glycosyltransferase [Thermosyntropha sp.]|uniref:glycosyltransferase n=1 Tax=Thermosyntropha sp. TaxID=2740820 RepID=UPI0025D50295|nr:glycosyltransferase [Thermosyntropha sp.]MBO8159800.1 glycosyltransferase [Thermosyntropha sp.]
MADISCILYPPTLDYYYLVQRPQQLMQSFARLGITSFYLNNPSPQSQAVRGIDNVMPNLYLFNNVNPEPYLKKVRPVVYYTSAAQADLIWRYNPSLVIFDSVDEPSDEFAPWLPYYEKAVKTADIVLTTSDKLYSKAREINPSTYLIPNGCDFEHFSRTDLPVPQDIAGIPRPIIGYIGVIASWLDLELIEKLANAFPKCNIVMLGPLYNVTQVPERPNIHWLGYKDYNDLPAYAQMFDVGIVPFKVTGMVEAVNPIKMWEYMAVGMPIVSVSIPEAEKYPELVYTAANHEEFIENVIKALNENDLEKRSRRLLTARENSWILRAQEIINIVEAKLAMKNVDLKTGEDELNSAVLNEEMIKAPPHNENYFTGAVYELTGAFSKFKVGRRLAIDLRSLKHIFKGKRKTGFKVSDIKINIISCPSFCFKTGRG